MTEATVATHLSRIYAKLGVRGRTELLARASQTLAGSQGPGAPAATPRRAVVSPWVGIAVAVFGFVAGLLVPLSSVILGPGLVLVALRWGESVFGWARWLVLVVGALLIAEGPAPPKQLPRELSVASSGWACFSAEAHCWRRTGGPTSSPSFVP